MKRRHVMPFGAQADEDGVRFRLWAPQASRVELELVSPARRAMVMP